MLTKKQTTFASSKDQQTTGKGAPLAEMATGRFTFQKRHLYFSLVVPGTGIHQPPPPRFLQFLSEDGNILEEQELTTNDYYNATGKV